MYHGLFLLVQHQLTFACKSCADRQDWYICIFETRGLLFAGDGRLNYPKIRFLDPSSTLLLKVFVAPLSVDHLIVKLSPFLVDPIFIRVTLPPPSDNKWPSPLLSFLTGADEGRE